MQYIKFNNLSIRYSSAVELPEAFATLREKITALFSGAIVNQSENRSASHFELRDLELQKNALQNISLIVDKLLGKKLQGTHHIVNIGVGGSNLGPVMACYALEEFSRLDESIEQHFISAMDGFELKRLIKKIKPENTTFIVYSKSFSTKDTFLNADTVLHWMSESLAITREQVLHRYFIGVSALPERMSEWGLPKENQLVFAESVGGRYSIWSAVGLPIALQIGISKFKDFLAGAKEMDDHFFQSPLKNNIPVLLGMLGSRYVKDLQIPSHLILPYDSRLKYFPDYLSQLEMESNGKSVTQEGNAVEHMTSPMVWGGNGTDSQHSFFQLLHQGTQKFSADIIMFRKGMSSSELTAKTTQHFERQHQYALANAIAQSRLFVTGNLNENTEPHKQHMGGNPVTTFIFDELTPFTLGQLIAIYEHKVFVMASIWEINPFDQWGVERGKIIADNINQRIQGQNLEGLDQVTIRTIEDLLK